MALELNEKNGVQLNACACACERCGGGYPAHQVTGAHGYVTLCVSCLATLLRRAVKYHEANRAGRDR